jgi:hypothetical protein
MQCLRGNEGIDLDLEIAADLAQQARGEVATTMHWDRRDATALTDQHVGLEETDDGLWSIYFNTVLIATLDERDYIIRA